MTTAVDLRTFPPVDFTIEPPETLRQTLLRRHDLCPRSAALYMLTKGGKPSHATDRGTAFHEVHDQAVNLMLAQEEQRMPGDVATELADSVMAEHPEWVLRAQDQDVVRLCTYNWAESFVLDPDALLGVELSLQIEIGGFTVTGRIDLAEAVGQTAYLHDYKTSLRIRKKEEVEEGFQGKLYALLVLFGEDPSTGLTLGSGLQDVFFYEEYPRYRTDEGPLMAREASWTKAEIFEFRNSLERNIANFADSLQTGDWPARDGSWCGECAAPTLCPIPAHLREVEEIETEVDAEDSFSQLMALERETARYRANLRPWVDEHGPVYVGDYAFAARAEEHNAVKDWPEFLTAVHRTAEFKVPFDETAHIEKKRSTKYMKRRKTKEERDGSDH